MKNIQVIDGAGNCTYPIYSVSEEDFYKIFPEKGQDVEFIDDFTSRVGEREADKVCSRLWKTEIHKKKVKGIHGTLFHELDYKKKYYPNKKEKNMIAMPEYNDPRNLDN